MELLKAQGAKLGQPQTGSISEFKNGIVAKSFRRRFGRWLQQGLNFRGGEIFRKFLPTLRQRKILGDVFGEQFFVFAEVVESAKGGDGEIDRTSAEFLFGVVIAGCGSIPSGFAGAGWALLFVQQVISQIFELD